MFRLVLCSIFVLPVLTVTVTCSYSSSPLLLAKAPWCGHCMVLEPKWYKLAQSFQHDKSVRISRLNCDLYHKVCQEYNVKGYPTLLWIVDGKVLDKYEGDRTVDAFKDYIALKTEEDKVSSDALRSEDLVVYLTQSNFRLGVSQGTTLVMFMVSIASLYHRPLLFCHLTCIGTNAQMVFRLCYFFLFALCPFFSIRSTLSLLLLFLYATLSLQIPFSLAL